MYDFYVILQNAACIVAEFLINTCGYMVIFQCVSTGSNNSKKVNNSFH